MPVTRGHQQGTAELLHELETVAQQLDQARGEVEQLAATRDRLIRVLRQEGASAGELARASRLSAGRVTQICDGHS